MSMTEVFAKWLPQWLGDGTVLDVILVGMVIEAAVLMALRFAPRAVLPYLGSGVAMLLAWRLAVGGAWWGWISACLGLAGLLHVVDLRARLGSFPRPLSSSSPR